VRAVRPRPPRGPGRLRRRARPGRGAARELVRLVQPHAGGERRPGRHPVGLDPVRVPRLHRAAGGRSARARAAAPAPPLLQPDARRAQVSSQEPPSPLDMLRDPRAIVDTGLGPVAFVAVNAATDLDTAAIVALAISGVVALYRAIRR